MAESTGFSGAAWCVATFHLSDDYAVPQPAEQEFIWGESADDIEHHIDYLAGPDGPFDERGLTVDDVTFDACGGTCRIHVGKGASFLVSI